MLRDLKPAPPLLGFGRVDAITRRMDEASGPSASISAGHWFALAEDQEIL